VATVGLVVGPRLGWKRCWVERGVGGLLSIEVFFPFSLNYRFDLSLNFQFKFESTQENPNKIQIKIQLITLANYKPKIIDGAKLNLGILGKKQEGILICCMSTQIQIKFLEIPHFEIEQF
jgi:hypothetical protein